MNSSFQERFKNRVSLIDRFGTLDVSASVAVSRPGESQVFRDQGKLDMARKDQAEVLRKSFNPYQDNLPSGPKILMKSESQPRKQAQSAKPFRPLMQDNKLLASIERPARASMPFKDFTPYTYKDYQALNNPQYYQLGGLGPAYVGTEDWNMKKQVETRRNDYIKLLNATNGSVETSTARKCGQGKKNTFMNGAELILGNRTPLSLGEIKGYEKNKKK